MAYIGTSPSNGVRRRFVYEATANQTSFSGNDESGITLTYVDSLYLDVYQNGVKLKAGDDYTATTGTTVVLAVGATADDVVEMVSFDVFSVNDSVSASAGGSFAGNIGMGGTLAVTGNVGIGTTSPDFSLEIETAANAIANFKSTDANANIRFTDSNSTANGYAGIGAQGNDLTLIAGNDDRMKIDSTGAVTMPNQPAFLSATSRVTNISGDGTSYAATAATWTDIYDQNADFSNGTFTAPVTGKYNFTFVMTLAGTATNHTSATFSLIGSNRTTTYYAAPGVDRNTSLGGTTYVLTTNLDMDASDTMHLALEVAGGSKTVVLYETSRFSGYLVA